MELIRKHAEKLRFAIVGLANTALDFVILFALIALGLNPIGANFISTGIAFIFSFFVNKSFTFKSKSKNVRRQFVLFLLVTMFGLWVLQPIVIFGVSAILVGFGITGELNIFIAKVLATLVSMVWGYIMYARVVFTERE